MTSSEVFYKTFTWTTKTIQKIFSLGYDTLSTSDNYLSLILFGVGQIAKYVIGIPFGLFLGLVVAPIVAIKNFFYPPQVAYLPAATIAQEPFSGLSASRMQNEEASSAGVMSPPAGIEVDVIDMEKERLNRNALVEKKNNLKQKINLLVQKLDEQITLLGSTCQSHEDILKECERLRSELMSEKNSAWYATKFSHYKTEPKMEQRLRGSCHCGFGLYLTCPKCHRPAISESVQVGTVDVPVYVPDEEKRNLAKANCTLIEGKLKSKGQELNLTLGDYQKRDNLKNTKRRLNNIIVQLDVKTTLSSILSDYLAVLDEVGTYFLADTSFKRAQYVPKSEYAQAYVASKMVEQIARQNVFFSALPPEIKGRIVSATALGI